MLQTPVVEKELQHGKIATCSSDEQKEY